MQGQSTALARSCMHHVNAGFAQLSAIRSLVSACGLDYMYIRVLKFAVKARFFLLSFHGALIRGVPL